MDNVVRAALVMAGVAVLAGAAVLAAYLRLARALTMVAATTLEGRASRSPWTALEEMGGALVAARGAQARALVEAELRRALIEAAVSPLISVDARGKVVDFNRAAELAFGREAADVVGRPVALLLDPESLIAAQRKAFRDFLATPEDRRADHRVTASGRRVDGSTFPIELSVTVLAAEEGPLFCASLRDVSDRFDALEARRESLAKSRFVAAMSHELRTPLNSMLGFAQLLDSEQFGALNPRQRRYIENIQTSGRHLLKVVNDVLDLAKVQSGHTTLEPRAVSVVSIVREVCVEAEPLAHQKQLSFDYRLPPKALAYADPTRLRQVLTNLIGNAIKFTPAHGEVVVRCFVDARAGVVRVDVEDTGPGIAPGQLDRIFEEFFQLNPSEDTVAGTGLGLALSRQLMEMMGGRLEVASQVGEGSVFSVYVPSRLTREVESSQRAG